MRTKVSSKGLRDVLKKLNKLGNPDDVSLAAVTATAKAGVFLREQAKSRCYVAPAPYTVTYQGRRVTLMPGAMVSNIIVKRIPKAELIGDMTAMHIVTVRQNDALTANIGKVANIYEARHPFMRPTAQADAPQARKIATKSMEDDVKRKWGP